MGGKRVGNAKCREQNTVEKRKKGSPRLCSKKSGTVEVFSIVECILG